MQIKDMFRKKIDREIQGVIIVGQGEETKAHGSQHTLPAPALHLLYKRDISKIIKVRIGGFLINRVR